jgi:hypothetical protein
MDSPIKSRGGRPANRADQFAGRLLRLRSGFSDRHCRRLIDDDPSNLSAADWRAVAVCLEVGISNATEFEERIREAGLV